MQQTGATYEKVESEHRFRNICDHFSVLKSRLLSQRPCSTENGTSVTPFFSRRNLIAARNMLCAINIDINRFRVRMI